jgi:hypothetical protein
VELPGLERYSSPEKILADNQIPYLSLDWLMMGYPNTEFIIYYGHSYWGSTEEQVGYLASAARRNTSSG